MPQSSLVDQALAWLAQQDDDCYIVGGFVRDKYLGRSVKDYDLDIATAADGLPLARRLAKSLCGAFYALDAQRGTGRVILQRAPGHRLVIDIAQFRGPDLASDLAGRDFTVNALAAPVHSLDQVIDHYGGREDLERGLIRAVSLDSIRDDPVRALRALRQAAQLGFDIEEQTRELIARDGPGVKSVSGERIRDELVRLLALNDSTAHLRRMDAYGLLTCLFPCLEPLRSLQQPEPHQWPALEHSFRTLACLEAVLDSLAKPDERSELGLAPIASFTEQMLAHLAQIESDLRPRLITLKLAALLHDSGKPHTRTTTVVGRVRFLGHQDAGAGIVADSLTYLRFSAREVRLAATIVRHHMRPLLLAQEPKVTPRAVYRFFRDTGPAGVEILLLALADQLATGSSASLQAQWHDLLALAARMLGDYWHRRTERVSPPSLISGADLIREFRLQPGPLLGELLQEVLEAQVSGQVHSAEDAFALVRTRLGS